MNNYNFYNWTVTKLCDDIANAMDELAVVAALEHPDSEEKTVAMVAASQDIEHIITKIKSSLI